MAMSRWVATCTVFHWIFVVRRWAAGGIASYRQVGDAEN